MENKEIKNAVIYARYSSDKQTEQSIEGQIHVIGDFAKREGYNIVGTYIDRAISGKTDDRPDFQRMINDSDSRTFNYVIVYKLDRFSRNRYDSAVYKKRLKDNGVKVISATENITESPEGVIFESIIEGYAEYYSAELAQKVKRGLRESRLKGLYTGGKIPYGYKVLEKRYAIDEAESEIVNSIFMSLVDGKKLVDIIADLNGKGIPMRDSGWTLGKVSRILRNECYIGNAVIGEETFDNIFPPIVDAHLFAEAQKIMDKKKHRVKNEQTKIDFSLTGKLFCMDCGEPMVGESAYGATGKVYHYYKCKGRKTLHNRCKKEAVKKGYLEDYVVEKTCQYILQPKYLKNIAELATNVFNENIEENPMLGSYEIQLAEIDKQMDNIVDAIKSGFKSQRLQEEMAGLEHKRTDLEKLIIKERNAMNVKLDKHDCEDFLTSLTGLDYSKEENKKLLVQRFIKKIVLGDKKIQIHFNPINKPFMYWKYDTNFGSNGADSGSKGAGNKGDSGNLTELSSEHLEIPPNVIRTLLTS